MRNLDIHLLRTYINLCDLGTLSKVAHKVGRTQGALSMQMQKLESITDKKLFNKTGHRLELTASGEMLLSYARKMIALNDEALHSLNSSDQTGKIRFGASQDFGEQWLPPVLSQFKKNFPQIELEVRVDGGQRLLAAASEGEIDFALALGLGDMPESICIGHLPLVWIAHQDFLWSPAQPLPLIVFPSPCRFRTKGLSELDARNLPWKVCLTSPGLSGVWAAVNAGLGVTMRTPEGLSPDLCIVDDKFNLPKLGQVDVSLYLSKKPRSPAVDYLVELLNVRLQERLLELKLMHGLENVAGPAPGSKPRHPRPAPSTDRAALESSLAG